MQKPTTPFLNRAAGLALFAGFAFALSAQTPIDPSSISQNAFAWTPEEIVVGFQHYDEVFTARDVPRGNHVHALPQGPPLADFAEGGEKKDALDTFLSEQKVGGLLVLQDGKIRLERYALGFGPGGRWTSQSVAKSVASTLVGAAVQDGAIRSVDDLLTDYIPDLKGSAYDSVTVFQLLTMTTGVRWNESYTDPESDLFKYYTEPITPGMDQSASYMRRLPAEAAPGTKWVYKTGETHLLGDLVTEATGKTLADYLSEKIWVPYGMEQKASWNVNRTGQELAGCCLQMSLRDFGRFGQFVLDGGQIDGTPVVPGDWFAEATKIQAHIGFGWGYGYQWWAFANGTFRALGIHGQMIHIDPAMHTVIVILSAWPEAENESRRKAMDDMVGSIAMSLYYEENR
ncbi:MAG: serine hydrolase [Bacteroidales bacterium]